jgi:hypothetical protein
LLIKKKIRVIDMNIIGPRKHIKGLLQPSFSFFALSEISFAGQIRNCSGQSCGHIITMTDSVRVPVGSNAIISINYQYPEDWRWANHRWLVQGTGISVGTPDGGLRAGTYNVNVPVSSLPPGVYTFYSIL